LRKDFQKKSKSLKLNKCYFNIDYDIYIISFTSNTELLLLMINRLRLLFWPMRHITILLSIKKLIRNI